MVPIDSKRNKPWLSANATLVALHIRQQAESDLLALDEQRSGGRLNAENGYSTLMLVSSPDEKNAKYTVDPVLSALKHTGADTDRLAAKRYAEFCSVPQDEEATIARLGLNEAENEIAKRIERGADLEAQIAELKKPPAVAVPVLAGVQDEPADEQSEPEQQPKRPQPPRRRVRVS